ncbi:MAG: hypoxanthine phosphoribosyltransferase [Gammaproteobacteria bacterium]|nr:hypoxanthine phosphoribosyltransferase [Gammaproteobacteria bacterium]
MILDKDIETVIASEDDINNICKELGLKITKDFEGEELVFVGLLNGCNPFFSDLLKHVDLKVRVDYMRASSYHGSIKSSNEVKILKDLDHSIKDKCVVVVDDIIDTGKTLKSILEILLHKGAKKVKTCVLLDKASARTEDYDADYVGLTIPNKFVVGYGLDYDEYYRNLPYIGVLKEEVYKA